MEISNMSPAATAATARPHPTPPRDDGNGDKEVQNTSRTQSSPDRKPTEQKSETAAVGQFAGPPKADATALAQSELDAAQSETLRTSQQQQATTATRAAHNAYGSTKALFG
ncbi:MAG: hypothetical protein P8X50_16640 [Maritimibacter sp.]